MPSSPEVDLVFADLLDAHRDLDAAATSPKQVRRAFSRFVELTQRLTSVMRKEFESLKGRKWIASEFCGWTEVTRLFKDLRNEEQHERQIHLSVYETRFYKPFDDLDVVLPFAGTWNLTDQLLDCPPDGITFHPADPTTGAMSTIAIEPLRVEYRFLIQARDPALSARLEAIGSANVHELAAHCLATLTAYHAFYVAQTSGREHR